MSVEATFERYKNVFAALNNTNLVAKWVYDETSLEEFKTVLNTAIPTTDEELQIGKMVRYFYRIHKAAFLKFIYGSNLLHLTLLTDGYPIAKALQIDNTTEIRWNKAKNTFDVGFAKRRNGVKKPLQTKNTKYSNDVNRHAKPKLEQIPSEVQCIQNTTIYEKLNQAKPEVEIEYSPNRKWSEMMEDDER
jgi:hypothetical protein